MVLSTSPIVTLEAGATPQEAVKLDIPISGQQKDKSKSSSTATPVIISGILIHIHIKSVHNLLTGNDPDDAKYQI